MLGIEASVIYTLEEYCLTDWYPKPTNSSCYPGKYQILEVGGDFFNMFTNLTDTLTFPVGCGLQTKIVYLVREVSFTSQCIHSHIFIFY
jgi:hypothetical protein